MSVQPTSNYLIASSSCCGSLFRNPVSKICAIFILVVALILVVITALSLPSITPIWSPLIPLGVLVLAIIVFCILSRSQKTPLSQKPETTPVEEKPSPKEKTPINSPLSTRQNSLSSLLNDDADSYSQILSTLEDSSRHKSDSISSIDTLLSSAIHNSFPSKNYKNVSISEVEDS